MKSSSMTIQMKATEQYFPVVLFIMLYKVVVTFESVDETLKCDHSNESFWAVQGGPNFSVCPHSGMKLKLVSSTFLQAVP